MELPDAALEGTGITPEWAKLEVAVALYRDRLADMGRAAKIAGLSRLRFQHELGKRGVTIDFGVEDLRKDIETLRSLGLL
ncbi:UPF0175 family protein [Luteolibacter sp. Populi]|uniref:UPF0175 family protein n=1 Tax=Luteolibacter sp. Populi TaxID=3230487 RepID=UPI003466216C